jgi:hypothetical protein
VVALSPEVMIFLFFMITDPKTAPRGRAGRRVYAVTVALLAVLLIAPMSTEFWTKVMLLLSLTVVCAIRPLAELLAPRVSAAVPSLRRPALGALAVGGSPCSRRPSCSRGCGRPEAAAADDAISVATAIPPVTVLPSGVQTQLDQATARTSRRPRSRSPVRVRGASHPQPRARERDGR